MNEQLCRTCELSKINAEVTGLHVYQEGAGSGATGAAVASATGSSISVDDF